MTRSMPGHWMAVVVQLITDTQLPVKSVTDHNQLTMTGDFKAPGRAVGCRQYLMRPATLEAPLGPTDNKPCTYMQQQQEQQLLLLQL